MITLTKSAVYIVQEMVKGRPSYGVRVKKAEAGCSGLYFDISLDKKRKGDVTLKKHAKFSVFTDKETKSLMGTLPKNRFKPATIDHVHTHLGKRFLTDSNVVRINIFGSELE